MTLEVVPEPGFWKRMAGLWILVVLVDALIVAQIVHAATHGGSMEIAPWMLLIAVVLLLLPLPFVFARQRWVARLDAHGVTLRNGRTFAWSEFQRIEPRYNQRLRIINHYELVFRTGVAGVFHRMAANQFAVEEAIQALQSGSNPFLQP